MKIEIGENLVFTYLKYAKGCRLVQTNWKTSSQWKISEYEKEQGLRLFEKIKQSDSLSEIFKNNSYDQLIKQAEIDVLGVNTSENSIFGIDVAFHEAGLNYGSAARTVSEVLKKLFRTVFISKSYFNKFDKCYSWFVTPKVSPTLRSKIIELIEEGVTIINNDLVSIEFITGDEFYHRIVDPLIQNTEKEYDGTDLFARAIKLQKLDARSPKVSAESKRVVRVPSAVPTQKRTLDGMKIGQYVQFHMRDLYERRLLSGEEIQKLQDKRYSKEVFNMDFEVLRQKHLDVHDATGHSRYYKEIFFDRFHLTSQWFERHWEPFLSWLSKIMSSKI